MSFFHSMRYRIPALIALLLVLSSTTFADTDTNYSGRILVRLKPGVSIGSVGAKYSFSVSDAVPSDQIFAVDPQNANASTILQGLVNDGRVLEVEAEPLVRAKPVKGDQLHFEFDFTNDPVAYQQQPADDQIGLSAVAYSAQGSGKTVAVLDSGVNANHPDLSNHLVNGYNAIYPGSQPDEQEDGDTNEDYGHGTLVAGVVAHVAPAASIMPIRVLNGDGEGLLFDVIEGIRYAIRNKVQVINMSFGTPIESPMLNDAIQEARAAGITVIASSGNQGSQIDQFPAACDGVLAVASVEADYTKSDYSNYGSSVTLTAPGTGIYSTSVYGCYSRCTGTSFAAPIVAGSVAVLLSSAPDLTPDDVANLLRNSAVPLDEVNPDYAGELGNGIICLPDALAQIGITPTCGDDGSGGDGSGG